MSEIEYNHLVFKVSERLEELNVRDQVLFMCRRKLASAHEDNIQDVLSLFQQLEERNFLGIDRLEVMKDLLRSFEEWNLLEKVERLESARKEYVGLLEQIVRALDEVSDLERLIAVCREKIPEATEGNVRDVRTLFRMLENHDCLGIDCLGILKEILTELEKGDQLKEVEKFEKRRCEKMEYQKRNAQVAAVVSTVRATGERMIGAVLIHCTFRNISGALLLVSTGLVLRRCSSLEQFVEAFREATLPAANALRAIGEGSVCFTVQAENRSALEALWQRYRDGTLQRDLQAFLVTDEIKKLAEGGEVTVGVYIDEQEFKKSLADMKNVEKQDATGQFMLNDLNDVITAELSTRLQQDPVALRWFCQVFGLDPNQMHSRTLHSIGKVFPVTPVKLLKDVFRALKLHDLEGLMEKRELGTLRPIIPLKEIEKLPNADNRPTNFYCRAEVLIIHDKETPVDGIKEKLASFFRLFDSRTEVTTVVINYEQLYVASHDFYVTDNAMLRQEKVVDLPKRREQWMKVRKPKIMMQIKDKDKEIQKEMEHLEIAVSAVVNKWTRIEDVESTLFIVYQANYSERMVYSSLVTPERIDEALYKTLVRIPGTKLMLTVPYFTKIKEIPQTLLVQRQTRDDATFLTTMLEILYKRWETLDLIAIMQEVQRTVPIKTMSQHELVQGSRYRGGQVIIHDTLTCLPRLKKAEENDS